MKFSVNHFESLKKEVVIKAGISSMTPADCKILSYIISKKTEQRISETTLKRIYGFAFSQFKPSQFTIDVLAKYCGYSGWSDFCSKPTDNREVPADEVNWSTLQQNADKITQFTLHTLKNRSGIPYNQTIKRAFIDDHLNNFLQSGKPATLLSAPAGYGKTISICHWLDERLYGKNNEAHQKDIFLVFSGSALMSVLLTGRDMNDWMLALLGYSADKDVSVLLDIKQRREGNFYLVIDGLDDHMIKNEQFAIMLDHLSNLLSFYEGKDWFRMILTIRTTTWLNNRHELDASDDKWYTGFKQFDECINVPLFSISEIKELCLKINPSIQNFIAFDVAENFNHPLFFQFYYKQHKEDFSLNNVDHLSIYELTSLFILNKIYLGQNSTEKILLINGLIDNLDIEHDVYSVEKLKVNELLKEYAHAYYELTSIGYLREVNESNSYSYNTHILFGNTNFLGHGIAKNILYNYGDTFDQRVIDHINSVFSNSAYKLPVLKWCIIHAIKTGQQNSFGLLTGIVLTFNEKCELLNFMGDLLEKEFSSQKRNESLLIYFKQDFSEAMFDYFFGLELISNEYKKTLNTLLKFELSTRKKILVYTAQAIIAGYNLNMRELLSLYNKLKVLSPAEYQSFAVNPLDCVDTIYHFFKFGIVKKEALIQLTKISFDPPDGAYNLKHAASNDMLYTLGSFTLLMTGNPKKSLRYLNSVARTYKPDMVDDVTTSYGFFRKILIADAWLKIGNAAEVSRLYYEISKSYKKSEGLLTPFMRAAFHCLRVKMMLLTGREDEIVTEMKCVHAVSDEAGSKFSKLYMLRILLQHDGFLNKYPNFKKQCRYDHAKMIRENELHYEPAVYTEDPL